MLDKYIGKRLDGRYEIQKLIGNGGMAMVYRAFDTIDDRVVAVKILKEEFLDNKDFIRRFKNESKAIAVLSHPNIVKVYDVSFGDIIQYIVMEYIEGITLKEYIQKQGAVSWKDTVYFVTQILQALEHAHSKGIIHRDVKPQNMMLLSDGTIKVTDFGIARLSRNDTHTMTEEKAIGSVHYISPEQARGDVTDERADIYSLGVLMYELLAGKLPFEADNAVSVAIMQMQSVPVSLHEINPQIPEGLEEIIMHAMQKESVNRYNSTRDMLKAITDFKANPSIKFAYKYLSDDSPTKYVNDVRQTRQDISSNSGYGDGYQVSNKTSEEAIKTKVKSKYMAMVLWIGISVFAVAVILALCAFAGIFNGYSKDVDVPNFIGIKYNEIANSTNYKFKWEVAEAYDADQAEGVVLDQDPRAGSKKVKENATIHLTVNSSGIIETVPNIVGQTKAVAQAQLTAKNLQYEVLYENSNTVEKGKVIRTDPVANSKIKISDIVKIYVSEGIAQVVVPDLAGKSLLEAKKVLVDLGLNPLTVSYKDSDYADRDIVLETDPTAGSQVNYGAKVTIYASSGNLTTKSAEIVVTLPTSTTTPSAQMTVSIGSVQDTSQTKTVDLDGGKVSVKVTGTKNETKIVKIKLDGRDYQVYSVSFEKVPPTVSLDRSHAFIGSPALLDDDDV